MAEILQTHLVKRFTNIMLQTQALQTSHLDTLKGRLAAIELAFRDVDPLKDQSLFIDYNIRPFVAPGDWTFEPCATHYDSVNVLSAGT
jgi:formin-binding protein 1